MGMGVEDREEFLMQEQLRENNMQSKIDYYWRMLDQNRNVKEFEKVYDTELILALGIKMVDTMAEEHERDLAALYKVAQNTTGFDDPAVHIRELEEVKKGNDLRKLVVANEMKRIDDALSNFKFINIDFDPEQNHCEMIMTFEKHQREMVRRSILHYVDFYRRISVGVECMTDTTAVGIDLDIKRQIDHEVETMRKVFGAQLDKFEKRSEELVMKSEQLKEENLDLEKDNKTLSRELKDALADIMGLAKEIKSFGNNAKIDKERIYNLEVENGTY
jgi:hypothetical protein